MDKGYYIHSLSYINASISDDNVIYASDYTFTVGTANEPIANVHLINNKHFISVDDFSDTDLAKRTDVSDSDAFGTEKMSQGAIISQGCHKYGSNEELNTKNDWATMMDLIYDYSDLWKKDNKHHLHYTIHDQNHNHVIFAQGELKLGSKQDYSDWANWNTICDE
ncbi:predicted protein [Scheffersomyces stipitis CBS 6054]|uniref:Uncharacterized protein n=1 Tax=Scheffersomyces stipitis (strain ATCC 58785 / CBS 6054 / NBRC 10063 / NRRL Y-11545) TaxID=322104 RepID=A3LMV6_PICST|nr:predicted protein [Scheffersomyces stipitis CBS 6054]ABN64221.2 predicted protein [Scheffersomyces stipitis CBS 6054]